jgi:hypothetical protein
MGGVLENEYFIDEPTDAAKEPENCGEGLKLKMMNCDLCT